MKLTSDCEGCDGLGMAVKMRRGQVGAFMNGEDETMELAINAPIEEEATVYVPTWACA